MLMDLVMVAGIVCLVGFFWYAMIEAQEQAGKEDENRRNR